MAAEGLADVKFDALRNALYHTARRGYLTFMNRALNFVVIIAGASAVSDFFGYSPSAFAFIATVAGTLQLVFDFGGRANSHDLLQRRYYDILSKIDNSRTPTEEDVCNWRSDLTKLCADEPPLMRALDAISYNNAADALDTDYRVEVNWFRTLTRHFFHYYNWSPKWIDAPDRPGEVQDASAP